LNEGIRVIEGFGMWNFEFAEMGGLIPSSSYTSWDHTQDIQRPNKVIPGRKVLPWVYKGIKNLVSLLILYNDHIIKMFEITRKMVTLFWK